MGGDKKKYLKLNTKKRKGGTRRAMGRGKLKPQLVITPLHGWINTLRFLEQAGYKLNYSDVGKRVREKICYLRHTLLNQRGTSKEEPS